MNEATIAESILKIASVKLKETPSAEAVLRVEIIAGEFRNVDVDSLQFAFDALKSRFNGCSHCALDVDVVKAEALCNSLRHRYRPCSEKEFRCSECGSGLGELIRGKELDIVNLTLQAS